MIARPTLDLTSSCFRETTDKLDQSEHQADTRTFEATMECVSIVQVNGHDGADLNIAPEGFLGINVSQRSTRIIYDDKLEGNATVTFSFETKCPGDQIPLDFYPSIRMDDFITLTFKNQKHYESSVTQLACSDSKVSVENSGGGGWVLIGLIIVAAAIAEAFG